MTLLIIFIWIWLRYAKSKGYILVAHKSVDVTWTFKGNQFIRAAVAEVTGMYHINGRGIFITGISDGGTFCYEFGLSNRDIFAALAPISSAMVVWPWHDFKQTKHLPVYILHGALARIIPVEFARSSKQLLKSFGYKIIYQEYPEWGDTTSYSRIGEVFTFFNGILSQLRQEAVQK